LEDVEEMVYDEGDEAELAIENALKDYSLNTKQRADNRDGLEDVEEMVYDEGDEAELAIQYALTHSSPNTK
jgi:transcriptional regulator